MCRCRRSNAVGHCHSRSNNMELLSTDSSILFLQIRTTHQSYPSNQGRNTSLSKTCFSCGQEGHITHTCPQKTVSAYPPNSASLAVSAPQNSPSLPLPANLPRSLCPCCQKGYHWAKECRLRFHRNRTFLGPDQQSGNGLRGQPQAPTTIGATTLNPLSHHRTHQSNPRQRRTGPQFHHLNNINTG